MTQRDIPSHIKRRLRQEACFGCCVCGHPFIEYHHIIPFSEARSHNASDMMILCPIHHHQCTVGALDTTRQLAAKSSPFNCTRGFANGQFVTSSTVIAIEAGSIQFIGAGFKLIVDGEPLLAIRSDSEGHLLLTVELYSSTDELLLSIRDNEWIAGDPLPWDLEFGYNRLLLRSAARQIALQIDARSLPVAITGDLWRRNQRFSIGRSSLHFDGEVQNVGFANLGLVAMSLVADTTQRSFTLSPDTRLKGGMMVSWPDPAERLQKGIEGFVALCKRAHLGRNERCPCGSGHKVKACHPEYCA
jgi:hypothetical protein